MGSALGREVTCVGGLTALQQSHLKPLAQTHRRISSASLGRGIAGPSPAYCRRGSVSPPLSSERVEEAFRKGNRLVFTIAVSQERAVVTGVSAT